MRFRLSLLSGALLWLNLLICPSVFCFPDQIQAPGVEHLSNLQFEDPLEPSSPSKRLVQEFWKKLEETGRKVVEGLCPLYLHEVEDVLEKYARYYDKLPNGFDVTSVRALDRVKSLESCDVTVLDKLNEGRQKLPEQPTPVDICIKRYLDLSFHEYLSVCVKIGGPKSEKEFGKKFGITDWKPYYIQEHEDPTYMDPELSKKLSQLDPEVCSKASAIERMLLAVKDEGNTWLAGYNVWFIKTIFQHQLWNCDSNRIINHYLARDKHKFLSSRASVCMLAFYTTELNSLIDYCKKRVNFNTEVIDKLMREIAEERVDGLKNSIE